MDKKDFKIIFYGTPDFASHSLKTLYEAGFNIQAVVTVADKPAGRGRKLQESAVKKYAKEVGLKILQPEKLRSPEFINELENINPDLQLVVAFRMLPEVVWALPKFGTINLHASLLPDYRGAAPINHAIINGEKKTGASTFFIEKEIDTGKIIFNTEVDITEKETAGSLHDKLMYAGADLLVRTVDSIIEGSYPQISQNEILKGREPKLAPKIFPEFCLVDWTKNTDDIYNFIRGLNPYPAASTTFQGIDSEEKLLVKVYEVEKEISKHNYKSGEILTDNKKFIKIATYDGFINLLNLKVQGKKRMNVRDLLNGFDISKFEII